jgi:hypothetical protein
MSLSAGAASTDIGTVEVANAAARLNVTRALSGLGTLVKQGAGTLAFGQTNATSAPVPITINAGTLEVDNFKVLGAYPVTLDGGTLLLRTDAPGTVTSPLRTTAAGGTIRFDRLTSSGATSGANVLPSLEVNGNTTLASPLAIGLSVTTLTNTATLDLANLPLTVTGNPTVLAGGAYLFGHNGSNAGVAQRGLWIAHSGTHSVTATFGEDADDADLLLGLNSPSAFAILTLNGTWRGGGGAATSTLAFSNSAQITLAPGLHFNTLTSDRTAVRPLSVVGSGSGRSTLTLDPAFVADRSNNAAMDDGLGQIQLADVTFVSQNSASLPVVTKLASVGGPTHRAGFISFDNSSRSTDSGAIWIVRSQNQAFDGGVRFVGDGQINLEKSLTLTGRVTQYADNQFQIASNRTLNMTGPGPLRFSGDVGFAPGSRLNGSDATVIFDGDPGAGWYAGNYARNPDGTVNAPPTPASNLALYVGANSKGGAVFNAPLTRLASLSLSGTAIASASLDPAKPNVLYFRDGLGIVRLAPGPHYLDLKNNAMITYGGGATSYASLRDMVVNHDVRSSLADAGHVLGYARASEVATLNPSDDSYTWLGLPVNGSDLLVRYTLIGDANLDGAVDFNDLASLAQYYNTTLPRTDPAWWLHGDFTSDGVVDFNDLAKLAQNYNTGIHVAPVPGASAPFDADLARAIASVPEPSIIIGGGVVGIVVLARRRR